MNIKQHCVVLILTMLLVLLILVNTFTLLSVHMPASYEVDDLSKV